MVILDFIICIKQKSETSNRGLQPDLNPGPQWVGSQLSPLPTEICKFIMSEVKYDNRHDSITFKIIDVVFSSEIEPRSPVGQAECTPLHHCGDDISNNQSSIKRIYMTLKCMCVFLFFLACFFSRRPIKNNSVTPYVFFMTTNKKRQCYPLYFI